MSGRRRQDASNLCASNSDGLVTVKNEWYGWWNDDERAVVIIESEK